MAPPAGQIRPVRYLAIFVAIVAALYCLVFFTGDRKPTPKLGIDLQGGTRVTLTARTPNGEAPSQESLNTAREIIENRVNGIGVSGSEVIIDGSNLVITVPGDDGAQAKALGQTAQLYFRGVQTEVAATPPATTAPTTPAPAPATTPPAPAVTSEAPAPTTAPPPTPQGRPVPAQDPSIPPEPTTVAPAPTTAAPAPTTAAPAPTPSAPAPEAPAVTTTPPAATPAPVPGSEAARVAGEIAAAKAQRQSTDAAVQQQALTTLDCSVADVLAGNDDPALPLVTCGADGLAKYVLTPAFLKGSDIKDATSSVASGGVGFEVQLTFTGEGGNIWAAYTAQNVGKQAAFVLDSEVVSAPRINSAITGGVTSITGKFSQPQAEELANTLKYGSLPLSFNQSEAQTVSASLGLASLKAGLLAGGIGLILVLIYCLLYYRLLGVLTALSLILSGVVIYAVLVLLGRYIGFTLDLAGIAGFIVAIGITADSFVVFFERLKDEVREGRSFRSAVPRGWVRARRTILSADAVSFLAAAVLYVLAVGQVKGFAFTLGMSTVLDLIVVFLVTHPLVAMASKNAFLSRPELTGLGSVQAQAKQRKQLAAAGARPKEA
ncbi:protein translocase subunit SecD [Rhodococcus sp. X156]|uniref:protein translocase subunit SecD n=1 Tax=Rhodococcus sp. X156 TaxID=2499145 RepID=UPI000FDB094F|nr:protein translocase subunit SecD [Rhodococcus sp. X156]